jgi:hypothetical protein
MLCAKKSLGMMALDVACGFECTTRNGNSKPACQAANQPTNQPPTPPQTRQKQVKTKPNQGQTLCKHYSTKFQHQVQATNFRSLIIR